MKKIILLFFIPFFMSACSLIPRGEVPAPTATYSWEEHQLNVSQMTRWVATGKIGIRTPDDSQSASLSWQQDQQAYEISLKGPLGQGGATISGDQHSATLEIPGEQPMAAGSPEELLSLRLGWEIPVKDAQYWIKGIPAPGSDYDTVLYENRLARLTQQGWEIEYQNYLEADETSLPGKLTLSRESLKLTLIIGNWRRID
ncbi:lipoprotein insertase outer membrane protein LolB [Neptunomonas qingdaonensis]|uniref:Outer-membrane lipoprotein LolB n=1 Tax=Neptunomonas qingdaonensis TaxID=1045558 RepID=A0A1I2TWS3_9GAMM|nr:lipoprotein insertase outer membrane protein LolB [Neptunomonas qingdaonensis]SFG69193.1 outer membrane lipoprotein LolB [Neptunomonas qingdaonensis]